jgi:uncharacterized membrane protein
MTSGFYTIAKHIIVNHDESKINLLIALLTFKVSINCWNWVSSPFINMQTFIVWGFIFIYIVVFIRISTNSNNILTCIIKILAANLSYICMYRANTRAKTVWGQIWITASVGEILRFIAYNIFIPIIKNSENITFA